MQIDIEELIGKRVTVACSGGGDSVALLHYLKEQNLLLSAVHIHHNIRQEEADLDVTFVENLCKAWNIPLFLKKFNIPMLAKENKMTIEEMGRKMRYQVFFELLQGQTDIVVTAHHSDDNVESVLFNLFRGTALKGMCGIKKGFLVEQGKIFRPMLGVPKREILRYLLKHKLQWREDSTNKENKYTRNFIRNEMLKNTEKYFPQYEKRVYSFCQLAKQDDDYLQQLAQRELHVQEREISFSIELPAPLFFRACIQAMEILGGKIEYTNIHLQDIYRLKSLQNGKKILLPKDIVAIRAYDKIVFYTGNKRSNFCIPMQLGSFTLQGRRYTIQQKDRTTFHLTKGKKNALYISGDNLQDVYIRTRREGDKFSKFSSGTKKLKEYFIDKKIPSYRRNTIPLLAKGSTVLAIFGVEIANTMQITEQTKIVLELLEEET